MTESRHSAEQLPEEPLRDESLADRAISDGAASAAEARVRRALADLDAVRDNSPEDQVEAFAAAHQTLQSTLSDIDSD